MKIGAQFYTLREHCKNLDDFALSLKRVADIGYEYVQISGTCEFSAEWLKGELDKNGLKCVITHVPPQKLTARLSEVIAEHDVLDCEHIGLGWYGFDDRLEECLDNFIKTYSPIVKAIKANGKRFMYHNHDHEFKRLNGRSIYEYLSDAQELSDMGFTLDTFWVQAGGADPAYWLERLSGRVPCIHLKDYAFGKKMAVLGEGNINFDRVFEKAESAGTEYMLVEQDECYGEDPFDCLSKSYKYLRSRGF